MDYKNVEFRNIVLVKNGKSIDDAVNLHRL